MPSLAHVNGSQYPVGHITLIPVEYLPYGFIVADGSAVSRTTYKLLFQLYKTRYGIGDGVTTFNLPDYRGNFLRGLDGRGGAGMDIDEALRVGIQVGTQNINGTIVNTSDTITVDSVANLTTGKRVVDPNFPTDTFVIAILSATSVQVSQPATGGYTGLIQFSLSAEGPYIGSYQPDDMLLHDHGGGSDAGSSFHSHSTTAYRLPGGGDLEAGGGAFTSKVGFFNPGVSAVGDHQHSILNTGVNETAPKNWSVRIGIAYL